MTIEDKLTASHEDLVEGITVLILKTLYENKVIDADADSDEWIKRVSRDVELWLHAEFRE